MEKKITFKIDSENLNEFDVIDLFTLDYDYFRLRPCDIKDISIVCYDEASVKDNVSSHSGVSGYIKLASHTKRFLSKKDRVAKASGLDYGFENLEGRLRSCGDICYLSAFKGDEKYFLEFYGEDDEDDTPIYPSVEFLSSGEILINIDKK